MKSIRVYTDCAMERLGLSQAGLARKLGVSPPRLNDYCAGRQSCPTWVLAALANAAGQDAKKAVMEDVLEHAKGKPYYADLVEALGKSVAGVALCLFSWLMPSDGAAASPKATPDNV
jgi:DNA-binding transcriptional regulator YdaS (Cro superfamily)